MKINKLKEMKLLGKNKLRMRKKKIMEIRTKRFGSRHANFKVKEEF